MEFKGIVSLSVVLGVVLLIASVASAPSNSTDASKVKPTPAVVIATVVGNNTKSANKTGNASEEDCDPEPEPSTGKNGTSADRQAKGINLDKDKYSVAAEPEPVNETAGKSNANKSDAEKLQGGNNTTVAPAKGSAPSSAPLWTNVIFATLLTFAYSAL